MIIKLDDSTGTSNRSFIVSSFLERLWIALVFPTKYELPNCSINLFIVQIDVEVFMLIQSGWTTERIQIFYSLYNHYKIICEEMMKLSVFSLIFWSCSIFSLFLHLHSLVENNIFCIHHFYLKKMKQAQFIDLQITLKSDFMKENHK